MDPLSQGLLGAAAPLSVSRGTVALAGLLGFLAGITPDLDVLIWSDSDPILFLEYHRQFTHSLVFIPVGGLLCAALLHALFARRRLRFRDTYLYCTLGYATHGLLDACTSYGTQLFWPFSTARVAWHNVSIIDPVFTVPLFGLIVIAATTGRRWWGRAALIWVCLYLGFGVVQRERAEAAGVQLAAERGHAPARLEAKPSFANLVVWKTIYEHDGNYYVDAVRAGTQLTTYPGERVPKLDLRSDFPWLDPASQQALDIERFRWFSAGYLAKSLIDENLIIDMRYSALPNRGDGLWGIVLSPDAPANAHVGYRTMRDSAPAALRTLVSMVTGDHAAGVATEKALPCGEMPGQHGVRCSRTAGGLGYFRDRF